MGSIFIFIFSTGCIGDRQFTIEGGRGRYSPETDFFPRETKIRLLFLHEKSVYFFFKYLPKNPL